MKSSVSSSRTSVYLQGGFLVLSLAVFLQLSVPVTARKDRNKPHVHNGVLTPYQPGPFSVSLTAKEEQQLRDGKAVMKQSIPDENSEDQSGGALCIQDVDAPVSAVWSQILDLESYPKKVPKLKECSNYEVKENPADKTVNIKTRMYMSILPGYGFESYYDHRFFPDKSSLTWTLDYKKDSDFYDVSGHWHVAPVPNKANQSRVFYACDIQMKAAVPKPVLNFIGKAALKQATSWVKRESEANPDASHKYLARTPLARRSTDTEKTLLASSVEKAPRGGFFKNLPRAFC